MSCTWWVLYTCALHAETIDCELDITDMATIQRPESQLQVGMTDPYINETVTYVAEPDKEAIRREIMFPLYCFLIPNLIIGPFCPIFCIISKYNILLCEKALQVNCTRDTDIPHRAYTGLCRRWSANWVQQINHSSGQYCVCDHATTQHNHQYQARCISSYSQ